MDWNMTDWIFDSILPIKSVDYSISGEINIGKSCFRSHRTASGNGLSGFRRELFAAEKLRRLHDNNINEYGLITPFMV